MSGILYINQDFLSAGRICRSLWKEFDISLCTHYREAHDWIRDLDPSIILVHYDPAFPRLAQMFGHFLEKDDRHRLIAIHARGNMEPDRNAILSVANQDSLASRLLDVNDDLPEIRQALKSLNNPRDTPSAAGALHGVSRAILGVNEILEKYAPSELPVLIVGESGTGKELAARRIHEGVEPRKRGNGRSRLRGFPGSADRVHPVRLGKRRLHRLRGTERRSRGSRGKHSLPRRDRESVPLGAAQISASARDGRFSQTRRKKEPQDGLPTRVRHVPRLA